MSAIMDNKEATIELIDEDMDEDDDEPDMDEGDDEPDMDEGDDEPDVDEGDDKTDMDEDDDEPDINEGDNETDMDEDEYEDLDKNTHEQQKTLEKTMKTDTFSNEKNNSLTESIKNIHATRKPIENMESLFCENILQREILVEFKRVGNNIEEVLLNKLRNLEGKCSKEGFIRPKSIELLTYSSGICKNVYVQFIVTFKCMICLPVTNTIIRVKALNKTKAGIRAESRDPVSPIDVFVTRDHNLIYDSYKTIQVGDTFSVKIMGHRFELNDIKISIIADIFESEKSSLRYLED
jgi:hypothetical protein